MWKKWVSLNLAILMTVLLIFPAATPQATAQEDKGYATFYKNDGSGASASCTIGNFVVSGGSLMLYAAMPDFEADGKIVTSFNSKADGTGQSYSLTSQIRESFSRVETAPAELYAQWTAVPDAYIRYLSPKLTSTSGQDYYIQEVTGGKATLAGDDIFPRNEEQRILGWRSKTTPDILAPGSEIEVLGGMDLIAETGFARITFHYLDWFGRDTQITRMYDSPEIYNIPGASNFSDKLFTGWYTAKDENEDGTWFFPQYFKTDAPSNVYAQYELRPEKPHIILCNSSGLQSGKMYEAVLLENGSVTLPTEVFGGKKVAYWLGTDSGYYPAGELVSVPNGSSLRPQTMAQNLYYGIVDGDGGITVQGSSYLGVSCYYSSAGDLVTHSFVDMGTFIKDGHVVVGYRGRATDKLYTLSEDVWDAMEAESKAAASTEAEIAWFTAKYQEVKGGFIQYFSNCGVLGDGQNDYIIQDGLDYSNLNGAVYLENTFAPPDGMSFLGWNTAPDGSGTYLLPGQPIQLTENTLLYAQWGQNRVTYHNAEAVETLTDLSYLQPSRLEAVKPNQIFAGWNTQKDGSGTWYSYGDCITPGTVLDLYAQSITRPTDIPYYWLSGWDLPSGKMAEIIQMSSNTDTITLPVTGFGWFRPGFDARTLPLYGFLDQQKGILAPGSSLTINTGTRIQQFRPSVAAILHNNQDSEEHRVFYSISSMGYLMLPDANNTFTAVPEDYIFAGWNTREDGTGEQMESIREPWDHTEVITLYAQWEPAFQTFIQYSGNGAVTSEGEAYVEINGLEPTSTFAQNMFIVPDGKYFLGWNTSPSGNGKWYMPGDTIPLTKNEILYAQWGLCRVTFHDGNFISQSNVMFDYIAPGYTGHPSSNQVFAGWNTAEDGSGTWYRAGMSIVHGAILDLYAQYLTKPETGYYYILSGYSVSPDLLAELKYMDALTEEITLPKSGIGWTTLNYPYEQPYGFLDEVEQFKAPGSTVTVTSGTIYHSLDNIACATLHKNTGEDNETRVFYRITTRGDLLLPSADAAFSDIPSDLVFTGWNTTADGSGQTLENMPVAVYWPTEYELYAQWEQKEAPEGPDMPPVVRPPHSSAQPDQPMTPEMPDFADVAPTAWYAEAVDYVVEAGLMTGTGGGKFSPEQTVSRAMVMTVLARLAGVDTDGGDTWYEKALVWAVESGITDGSNPTGIITREQLVTMLYRQAGSPTQDTALSGFDDIDTVSPWAEDAMIWAVEHNILNGINGSLVPQGTATRAQMAALFQRILEQA